MKIWLKENWFKAGILLLLLAWITIQGFEEYRLRQNYRKSLVEFCLPTGNVDSMDACIKKLSL